MGRGDRLRRPKSGPEPGRGSTWSLLGVAPEADTRASRDERAGNHDRDRNGEGCRASGQDSSQFVTWTQALSQSVVIAVEPLLRAQKPTLYVPATPGTPVPDVANGVAFGVAAAL